MATISIKQNMRINDPKKVAEVLDALNNKESNFKDVQPANRENKTNDVAKIWFKR